MIGNVINCDGVTLVEKHFKTEPPVCKTYYNYVDHDNEEKKQFKRYSYIIPRKSNTVVTDKPHFRTCPSVLRELEQALQSPSVIYKKKVSMSDCLLEHQPVLIPRNKKKIANMQWLKIRLTHDALYNLHELSYDLGEFFHKIVIS